MCIYCGTAKYRKIYEQHCGIIPKDEFGRSYHIHHKDGNRNNNDISNLQCVSLQDHYNIHYAQGDWIACLRLAVNLNHTAEEISNLSRVGAIKRVENNTHNFIGGEIQRNAMKKRVAAGTHNLLGDRNPVHLLVEDGTHHLLGGKIQRRLVAEGKHHLLGGDIQRRAVAEGRHNSSFVHTCPKCGKVGKGPAMFRHHFDKCRF